MKTTTFWLCILLTYFSPDSGVYARQSGAIPYSLVKTLDSLKLQNDLSGWLYARIDYSYTYPRQSLPFLMDTEKQRWRKPASVAEKEAWLLLLSNQGYNQMYTGNILNSINCYEQAYNYAIEHKLNVEGIADYVLKPWANNCTRLGDYEKALFIQQKTLEYASKEHDDLLAASVYNNMAISYRSLGDFKKAEQCVRRGVANTPEGSQELILLDNTLADIYNDKEELDQAEKVIRRNISRQQALKPNFETAYWLLSSYITAGDVQRKKQNFKAAQNHYKHALAINNQYYKGNRLREKAYVITQLGKLKLSQRRAVEALEYFNSGIKVLGLFKADGNIDTEKIIGDNRIIDLFYQKALTFQSLGNNNAALHNIRLSLLAADKIRFELSDEKTKQRFQAETKQRAEKAVEIAFQLLETTKQHRYALDILSIFEQTKSRILLDEIYSQQQRLQIKTGDTLFKYKQRLEQAIAYNERELLAHPGEADIVNQKNAALKFKLELIENKLKDRYPALNREMGARIFSQAGQLKQLPASAHIFEFFAGSRDFYVLELRNNRIKHVKKITNAAAIKKQVINFTDTYYRDGPAAMIDQPKKFFLSSNHLYQLVFNGFDLKHTGKLIIIPDGVLGYLSFDGLLTDDNYSTAISSWPYMVKRNTISYAFSIQTMVNQSLKKKRSSDAFTGLFITGTAENTRSIPAVVKEEKLIKSLIRGNFLDDKQASTKNFFRAFDQSAVLHISTHSFLSGRQKEPTLLLSDDRVFLFELLARTHAPALVVLSACQTADGRMADGEGIISFSRGFAAVGTQGTIAGLWKVNDDAAAKLTADFYSQILKGKDVSTSLRRAKLNWISSKTNGDQQYLPYYWDALIYMGTDQKLNLITAGFFTVEYMLFVLFGLALVVDIFLRFNKTRRIA